MAYSFSISVYQYGKQVNVTVELKLIFKLSVDSKKNKIELYTTGVFQVCVRP